MPRMRSAATRANVCCIAHRDAEHRTNPLNRDFRQPSLNFIAVRLLGEPVRFFPSDARPFERQPIDRPYQLS